MRHDIQDEKVRANKTKGLAHATIIGEILFFG